MAPHIVPAAHSLGITGGHCDQTGFAPDVLQMGPREGIADGVAGLVEAVRQQVKYGAQVIKICATAGVLSFEATVGGAAAIGRRSCAPWWTKRGATASRLPRTRMEPKELSRRCGPAWRPSSTGPSSTDEILAEMKQRGTYLVPTTYLRDIVREDLPEPLRSKRKSIAETAKASHRKAIAAGVKMAFGTDAGVFPHGQNAREFASLVSRGMTPLDALRNATINAADLLGATDRGEIAPGKLADLVALPGNPLEDIRVTERPAAVVKGGWLYRVSERQ